MNTCLYSRYYDYTLSINGQAEQHGQDYEIDYLTDVIRRKALDWLKGYRNAKDQLDDGNVSPFLMVLAPPAPHAPSVSAPQYKNEFLIRKAPRNPSFNYVKDGNRDKHWLMRYNRIQVKGFCLPRIECLTSLFKLSFLLRYLC